MNNKEYTLVPAKIPPLRMARLRELVAEFRANALGTRRVEGTKGRDEAMRVRSYLTAYVRRSGISDVKVVIRGFDVYLVKKEEE